MARANVNVYWNAEQARKRCPNFIPAELAVPEGYVTLYARCQHLVNHHRAGIACSQHPNATMVIWEYENDPQTRATNELIQRIIEQSPRLDARGVEALLGDLA